MSYVVAIVAILIIIIFATKNKNSKTSLVPILESEKPTTTQQNISVPDPETANPKDVIFFIDNYSSDVVSQSYQQLKEMRINIPLDLNRIFLEKINKHYIIKENYYWQISIEDYQIEKENLKNYPDSYSFDLKGLQEPSYKRKLHDCIIFEKVNLKKEPSNKYDPNAIKVVAASGLIGYVPADETDEVHKILSKDHKAFIKNILDLNGFIDCTIVVYYNDTKIEQKAPEQKTVHSLFPFDLDSFPDAFFIEGNSETGGSGDHVRNFRKTISPLVYNIFDTIEVKQIGDVCKNMFFISYDLDSVSLKDIQQLTDDLYFIYGPDGTYQGKFNKNDQQQFRDEYNLFRRSWTDSKYKYPATFEVDQEMNSITLSIWGIGM